MTWLLIGVAANIAVNALMYRAYDDTQPRGARERRFRARAKLACVLGVFVPFFVVQAIHHSLAEARDLQRRFWRLVAEATKTDEDSDT